MPHLKNLVWSTADYVNSQLHTFRTLKMSFQMDVYYALIGYLRVGRGTEHFTVLVQCTPNIEHRPECFKILAMFQVAIFLLAPYIGERKKGGRTLSVIEFSVP